MTTGGVIAVAFLAIVVLLVIRGTGKPDAGGIGTHVDPVTDHEGWDGGESD